jgi:hypothetical protein
MSIFGNKPEDKFKDLFLYKRKSQPEIAFDNNDIVSSYIAYLLSSVNLGEKDFGIVTSKSKHTSYFVWRLSNGPLKLNFREKSIEEIFEENTKNDSACKECSLYSAMKDNEHYKKAIQSIKIEESIKKNENICDSCKPNLEAIISQFPQTLGYEDSIKLKNPIDLEESEKGFCKILYTFLYESLKNRREIWGASNVSIEEHNQEYDVIMLLKGRDGNYKILQIEIKFSNQDNLTDDNYKKFLDRHVFLENTFKQFSNELSISSILFDPYNVETFYKRIESIQKNVLPSDKNIIAKAMKEKRIACCFSSIRSKKEVSNFLKEKKHQNINEHAKKLLKMMT